jgi:quercetin dioxygenase-like cupin family protein
MKRLLTAAALLALAGTPLAQDTAKRIKPEDMVWQEVPFPKGVTISVLIGDQAKAGVLVQHDKWPPNTKMAPHAHSFAEVVTVLSGSIGFGLGETFDPAKGEVVKAGSVNVVPAHQAHFLWTENEGAIIQRQITLAGPGDITFVNPADDPRKK